MRVPCHGADASAGVIQIITKSGRAGAQRFNQSLSLESGTTDQNWTPPSNFARCSASLIAVTSTNPLCRGQELDALVSDFERGWVERALGKAGGVRKRAAISQSLEPTSMEVAGTKHEFALPPLTTLAAFEAAR